LSEIVNAGRGLSDGDGDAGGTVMVWAGGLLPEFRCRTTLGMTKTGSAGGSVVGSTGGLAEGVTGGLAGSSAGILAAGSTRGSAGGFAGGSACHSGCGRVGSARGDAFVVGPDTDGGIGRWLDAGLAEKLDWLGAGLVFVAGPASVAEPAPVPVPVPGLALVAGADEEAGWLETGLAPAPALPLAPAGTTASKPSKICAQLMQRI
jgi:hypothetical protein